MNKKLLIGAAVAAVLVVVVLAVRKRTAVKRAGRQEKAAQVAPSERVSIDVDAGETVLKPE